MERQLIQEHFSSDLPTTVIPNGVEIAPILEAQPNNHDPARKVILCSGRMEHYKQADMLVKAAPHLPHNYDVIITGDGPAREQLESLIKELQLEGRVRLPGYISREELLSWFRRADVFVSMSKNEAFGLAVLEGAAGGASVVASNIPAHREIATEYVGTDVIKLVALDSTPRQLAETIQQAAAQHPTSQPANWALPTWEGTIEGALKVYERVLGRALLEAPITG